MKSKMSQYLHDISKCLTFNIWYVIYILLWIKYKFMRFVNYCIPFLFTICTVSQLFWNRVCIYIYIYIYICSVLSIYLSIYLSLYICRVLSIYLSMYLSSDSPIYHSIYRYGLCLPFRYSFFQLLTSFCPICSHIFKTLNTISTTAVCCNHTISTMCCFHTICSQLPCF